MKKVSIIGGVILIIAFLAVRPIYLKVTGSRKEREWFAREIKYEFSARVDSVKMYHARVGLGLVNCRLLKGEVNPEREDSLVKSLSIHRLLRFVETTNPETYHFTFQFMRAEKLSPGDSLVVSSSQDSLKVFRDKNKIIQTTLSESLKARGGFQ